MGKLELTSGGLESAKPWRRAAERVDGHPELSEAVSQRSLRIAMWSPNVVSISPSQEVGDGLGEKVGSGHCYQVLTSGLEVEVALSS